MKLITILLIALLFTTGCSQKQSTMNKIFQTSSATNIKNDYSYLINKLLILQDKLNKRNPKAFNPDNQKKIKALLKSHSNNFYLQYMNRTVQSYNDYLQIAFSKDEIKYRNDFLIMGLYYAIFNAFEIDEGHRISAMMYDSDTIENLYKNLQIVKWKIKANKDLNQNYLFLTWQNNWQIQLEQTLKRNKQSELKNLTNLEYIRNKKETLLSSSNMSFEVLFTQMIDKTGQSLEEMGVQPEDLTVDVIKTMFIFL